MVYRNSSLPTSRVGNERESAIATQVYRLRWPLAALMMALVALLFGAGGARVAGFGAAIASLGDTTNGAGAPAPLIFDPRMELWFGEEDQVVEAYHDIEERFVAEDYLMVTFEQPDGEFGVFERDSLATIARMTERFLRVPGVRHVRSLTSNPWIRSGAIAGDGAAEHGLLISDLVEGDPLLLTDDQIVERMIAVLGAQRTAKRVGEPRVRALLGPDADFADHIGEPLLLGTIIDDVGSTTAIQVQVLRPRVDEDALAQAFVDDPDSSDVAVTLYSIQAQRAALRGLEHVIRQETGLAVPTAELAGLTAWVESQPDGDAKEVLRAELANPSRNFMPDGSGTPVRKFYEYEPDGAGGLVDLSDPANPIAAATNFTPRPLSGYTFHVGGVPYFELNFERVGMSDAKYMGLMFVAIVLLLAIVFRSFMGVAAALIVVMGGIAAMVGAVFARGDLMNNMTMIAPNMLTAVAIGDAVHLLASWTKLRKRYDDKRALMIEVIRRNALPVFLTSVTTAVGFASLTVSEMVPVSMFGGMAAFGTLIAWGISMTVVPACLSLVPLPKRKGAAVAVEFTDHHSGWEQRLTSFILRSRTGILITASVLFVISVFGLTRLRVDSDFRAMFPADNPVMSDFNWIEARMGGVGDLEIVFTGGALKQGLDRAARHEFAGLQLRDAGARLGESALTPLDAHERAQLEDLEATEASWQAQRIAVSADFLRKLDAFETRLREEMADPESPMSVLSDLASPLDILRQLHRVLNDNSASYYRVPVEADVPDALRTESLGYDEWAEEWVHIPPQNASTLAAQYYLQYENGAKPGENLSTQISLDRRHFRMQGRIVQAPSEKTVAAVRRIEEIARTEFPSLGAAATETTAAVAAPAAAEMNVSGKMFLFARTNRIFTIGFIQSMSIALVSITLLIGLFFRSARMALVSLVPNLLPILMPLSVFGLLGTPLDAPAIFVSSVALGVCVDDTLHFFTNFRRAQRRGLSFEESIRYVYETTGRAITFTTVILIIGFGTLVLSDFSPNYMMGTLASSMIALAWVADMVVTPAVLSLLHGKAKSLAQEPAQPQLAKAV